MSEEQSREGQAGIQKRPVPNRDETGVDLFGWTWSEIFITGGMALFVLTAVGQNWLGFGMMAVTILWLKKFKDKFPERFLNNAWKHFTRSDRYWRAASPDTEWRPPVR